MTRPVCLIVNPSAGGGRAAQLLPAVEAALRGARDRVPRRAHALDRARPRARAPTVARRRDGRRDGRRRADRRRRGRAARHRRRARRAARRPRQRLRAQARDRQRPRGGLRRARRRPRAARSTSPTSTAAPTSASPPPGSTPTPATSPTRRGCAPSSASSSTSTPRCARCGPGGRRTGRSSLDGEPRSFTGYSVAVCNSGVFGGGMYLAPDASLDDGMLDVVMIGDIAASASTSARSRRCSTARTCASPASTLVQAREVAFDADRPFTCLRRRRPDRRPARPPCACSPARCG